MPNSLNFPESSESQADAFFHCPFKGFDGCKDGVGGRGHVKNSLLAHSKDKHLGNDRCKNRLPTIPEVYKACEDVLIQLQMWICTECMVLHSWRRPCKHNGVILPSPFNGNGAECLIHGITCPSSPDIDVDDVVSDNAAAHLPCLNLDLLDKVFQKQLRTIKNIPPKCKLQFSRVLKFNLDRVIASPRDASVWVQLLLLLVCVLQTYVPKSNAEEKNLKKLQISSINRSIARWFEPQGCIGLAHELLLDNKQTTSKTRDKGRDKESKNLN
ncbi:hypothetical protein MKW92_004301, partial [Papaver armeniacum]